MEMNPLMGYYKCVVFMEDFIMALIKCPECGKDVSDAAIRCPSCGYDIKKYIREDNKQELKQKSGMKSIKQQTSLKKKIIILTIDTVVIITAIFVGVQKQRDKNALMNLNLLFSHTEDISEYKTYAVMEVDGIYYYHDAGADTAISKISQRLSNVDICVNYIEEHYSESRNAIDNKIEEETDYGCRTWEEYRERLNSNYFLDEDISNHEKAEKIVMRYVDRMVD